MENLAKSILPFFPENQQFLAFKEQEEEEKEEEEKEEEEKEEKSLRRMKN